MMDVVAAFGGGEARQTRTEERPERHEKRSRQLTTVTAGELAHSKPVFLPEGRGVLFYVFTGDRATAQVAVYNLATGERKPKSIEREMPS